jgi:hypothetical protein
MKNDLGYPVCIGNRRRFIAIDGEHVFVTIEDEIVRPQGPKPYTKLIYLQKLKFEKDGHIEYRFTYYMKGVKEGRTKGQWVFAQYSLVVPAADLKWLLKQARKRQWKGFE